MNTGPIERTTPKPRLFRRFVIAVACVALVATGLMLLNRRGIAALSATERPCVGSWAFISPDNATTRVVYQFDPDRRVREEHFYLSSATPGVPRITMLGQWHVESDGRLIVEPAAGLTGLADKVKGIARDALDDEGRIPRPILRRFYRLQGTTANQLTVTAGVGGGKPPVEIVMNRVK